uniref:Uncharacterized protein n=1 Tax=Timema tahoe TaxID=61484 RepID=A0A7R9II56_9NEOP|nr:unnamed protein product [Timema tahoe]
MFSANIQLSEPSLLIILAQGRCLPMTSRPVKKGFLMCALTAATLSPTDVTFLVQTSRRCRA